MEFGIEATGRYGGIGLRTGHTITVDCLDINDVISDVLSREGTIDILKVDTEGVEIKTVEAIRPELARKIRRIYLEARPSYQLHAGPFRQKQHGSVCHLINQNL
jgi:hypothetical protein